MQNISRFILLFLIIVPTVFALGSGTVNNIDEIKNNTGSDILLNPTNKVKIQYFTGEKVLQSSATGQLDESSVTNTELGYLSGVTSLLQDQLDNKQDEITGVDGDLYYYNSGLSNLSIGASNQFLRVSALGFPEWADLPPSVSVTTKGDLQTHDGTDPTRLPVGSDGYVLSANSATATGLEWITPPASYVSPTTTEGDLILRGASTDERLAIGANGTLLTSDGTTASWQPAPISLPTQTGQSGKYLKTNGTTASWNEVNNDINDIKNNLLNCASFEGCSPEGVITLGSGVDLSGTTTRTVEASAYNTTKFNAVGSATDTISYKVTKSINFESQQMYAYCEIKTTKPLTVFRVYSDSNLQASLEVNNDDKWRYYKIPFVGGVTSQEFEIYSSDTTSASGIDIDNCYIGKAHPDLIQNVSDAHLVGISDETSASSCLHSVTVVTSGTYYSIPSDANCANYVNNGNIKGYDDLTKIQIPNARTDGYYKISLNAVLYPNTTGNNCVFALFNNESNERFATTTVERFGTSPISYSQASNLYGSTRFSTNGSKDIELKVSSNQNSTNCYVLNNSTGLRKVRFEVHFFPDDKSTIVTQDTELTAKTANLFSADISASGIVSNETFDFISGNCTNAASSVCTFNSDTFKEAPKCWIEGIRSDISCTPNSSITNTSISHACYNSNGTALTTTTDRKIWCEKSGTDYNKSATIVGKFENINSSELVKVDASGNSGQAITANVTNITWSNETVDNYNAWNGTTFTAPKDSWYLFAGAVRYTTNANRLMSLRKNSSLNYFCGQGQLATTPFTCFVYLSKNDTATVQENASSGTLSNVADHKIYVTELPDTESVIANISKQKTKCQTKVLSANVTTTGTVSDLSFSNLNTSKYYSLTLRVSEVSSTLNSCRFLIGDGSNNIINIQTRGADATEDRTRISETNPFFKPISSNLTMLFIENTNCTLEGDGTISTTYATLCELPDSLIQTTEFN